jgi:regulator of replication initiation timing
MSEIKLYEAAQYYSDAIARIEEPEQVDEVFATLDALDVTIKEKVESIGDIITNYLAEEAALKAEAKRLNDRAASAAKKASGLMDYIDHVMRSNKFEELKGLKYTFNFTTSESLKCLDPNSVPKHYRKHTFSVDVAGIKSNLKKTYDEKGTKLVSKLPKKPKGNEMLYTELNDSIRDMGLEFVISKKLKMK